MARVTDRAGRGRRHGQEGHRPADHGQAGSGQEGHGQEGHGPSKHGQAGTGKEENGQPAVRITWRPLYPERGQSMIYTSMRFTYRYCARVISGSPHGHGPVSRQLGDEELAE